MISNPSQPAVISDDGLHRYFLSRTWSSAGLTVAFIGLNPSTADSQNDDPTIRRCVSFAKQWGGSSLWMVNLFAYRATKPSDMITAADPVGSENDVWLDAAITNADIVVAAWGNHGHFHNRGQIVRTKYLEYLKALRVTKSGMPSHPLYIPASTALVPYC